MRFARLAHFLFDQLLTRVAGKRDPDFVVGADALAGAYLRRWYLTPWRRWQSRLGQAADAHPTRWNRIRARLARLLPNLYLHQFLRDDDDRALHDHPSWAASLILRGSYIEHTIDAGGIHQRRELRIGTLRFLPTRHTHRVELVPMVATWESDNVRRFFGDMRKPCWTLFLFGPVVREWGFHCPQQGWIHWKRFTAADNAGETGPGCDA